MSPSTIEWTDETWNPTVGCSRVSPGCDHCYAERQAARLMSPAWYGTIKPATNTKPAEWSGKINLLPDRLDTPLHWRQPRRVFVDSMSDLFHLKVPDEFIARVFAVMHQTPRHTYQVLTKRALRMQELVGSPDFLELVQQAIDAMYDDPDDQVVREAWPVSNIWLGISAEDQRYADLRTPHLQETPAAVRFLSCEPLLGPINLRPYLRRMSPEGLAASPVEWDTSHRIDWVIVGGESGPGARPMHPEWARAIRDECINWRVPFHFKQWGEWGPAIQEPATHVIRLDGTVYKRPDGEATPSGCQGIVRVGKKAAGRELDGRTWDEYPREVATSTA